MSDQATVAQLFIRLQQRRDLAWRAHIGKREREAIEQVAMLQLDATKLLRLLQGEENGN